MTPLEPAGAAAARKSFVLVSCDFVKTGGMDRANYALASYLARAGHEIHAVGHAADDELLALPSLTFHRVPKPLGSYFLGEKKLDREGRSIAARVAARGGRAVVNGGNCSWGDANWVHYVHAAYVAPVRTGPLRRIKHAYAHRAFLRNERRALAAARVVFANSKRTAQDLMRHVGVPEEKIHVVYYGIDPEQFQPADAAGREATRAAMGWGGGRRVAAFIGALGDRRKGFDTALLAWRELCRDRAWDVDLAVIGRGAETAAWQRRAEELGLAGRVHFLGFRRDVPDVLKACDALVAPTRYEAYGLGVHEALCCGLPALVSADAGVAERYPAALSDLLLPDADDAPDLARRLRNWRDHAPRYQSQVEALSRALRSRTWDDMAADMEGILDAVG